MSATLTDPDKEWNGPKNLNKGSLFPPFLNTSMYKTWSGHTNLGLSLWDVDTLLHQPSTPKLVPTRKKNTSRVVHISLNTFPEFNKMLKSADQESKRRLLVH